MQRFRPGLLAIAAAGLMCLALGAQGRAKVVRGQAPPDITGTALDGRRVALSDSRGKNPVVLNFFAEFSPHCRTEFGHLKELDEKYGSKGLKIVAVSMDETRAAAAVVPKEARVKFPILFDAKGEIADRYEVQVIPHTVVIDREGKVHALITGLHLSELTRAVEQVVR